MSQQTVLVFGATGQQGGSVVRALAANFPQVKIRGVCRDKTKEKAKRLQSQGVELVEADVTNKQELTGVFDGVDFVFAVTDSYSMGGKEFEIGSNMVQAAEAANVKFFVWSSLPNVKQISGGKWEVPIFTNKALVDDVLKKSSLSFAMVAPAFFYQNFKAKNFFAPKVASDAIEFTVPIEADTMLPGIDIDELGECVIKVLTDPERYNGSWIPLAGDHKRMKEYMQDVSEVTGKKVRLTVPALQDLIQDKNKAVFGNLFLGYFSEFGYYGPKVDPLRSQAQYGMPKLKTFKQWLLTQGEWIPELKRCGAEF